MFENNTRPSLKVRLANPNDADKLAELAKTTFKETYPDQFSDQDLEMLFGKSFAKNFPTEIQDKNTYYVIVELNNKLIGYAKLVRQEFNLILDKLYFLKTYQNKGYGKEVFLYCCVFAIELGYKELHLTVWEENKNAILFYEKLGFVRDEKVELKFGNKTFFDYKMHHPDLKEIFELKAANLPELKSKL